MNRFKKYSRIFSKEEVCVQVLKAIREQYGLICKKCGNETHYWKNDKKKFECKECNYRTSLKQGTVMENSNLPLQYWLSVIAYVSTAGENISALKLQKELEHNRYEPVLRMIKKIRRMSETDIMKQRILEYVRDVNAHGLSN